ncbi:MAG TPA: hypothetical protein VFN75_08815 [Pseudonocardiaceae bacterium]|nr:hypothetical protein [Pseudonocardiaceae bacterium]
MIEHARTAATPVTELTAKSRISEWCRRTWMAQSDLTSTVAPPS